MHFSFFHFDWKQSVWFIFWSGIFVFTVYLSSYLRLYCFANRLFSIFLFIQRFRNVLFYIWLYLSCNIRMHWFYDALNGTAINNDAFSKEATNTCTARVNLFLTHSIWRDRSIHSVCFLGWGKIHVCCDACVPSFESRSNVSHWRCAEYVCLHRFQLIIWHESWKQEVRT